jgi:hypothetical protein
MRSIAQVRRPVADTSPNGEMESRKPGLDHFWEQADEEGSTQHPLERELAERLDALARYRDQILQAEANERASDAEILLRQHEREYQAVQRLWSAIRRLREKA